MAARRASLGAIFFTVFLDLLGFGLVLPFLAEEARSTFHVSAFTGTLLSAVYSAMQFLFIPIWGRLSDRIGRKPVLVWSVFATAIGMAGLAGSLVFGSSVALLFVARAWSGVATANLGTASAYIADVTGPEDRAKGMGLIGVAFGLGFILGPSIGGPLAEIAIHGRTGAVPCLVAAGLSLINFAWVLFGLPESLPKEARAPSKRRLTPIDLQALREALELPGVGTAVLVNFVLIFAFTGMEQTFRFFNQDRFAMGPRDTGYLLAMIGVIAALVQGGMRGLSRRYSEAQLIRAGSLLQTLAFAGFCAAPSLGKGCLYVAGAVLALGNGLTQPNTSAYVSKRASRQNQGATLGVNQSIASLARVFGPATGGLLYSAIGSLAPYVASTLGMAAAFVLALRLTEAGVVGASPTPATAPAGSASDPSSATRARA